jgi:predicted RNase H-like nuclease (RuvC/YqgF family)
MMLNFAKWITFVVILFPFLMSSIAWSQQGQQDDRAVARAQQMLRQMSAEKVALEQEINKLRQEQATYRRDMEKSLAAAESKQKDLASSISDLTSNTKQRDKDIDQLKNELVREQEKVKQLEGNVQIQTENLQFCQTTNDQLVVTANELIDLYNNKGFKDVLGKREPITGIAKVKVENIVQSYTDKIEENKLENKSQGFKPLQEVDAKVAGSTNEE